jgi:hypothetical protein
MRVVLLKLLNQIKSFQGPRPRHDRLPDDPHRALPEAVVLRKSGFNVPNCGTVAPKVLKDTILTNTVDDASQPPR